MYCRSFALSAFSVQRVVRVLSLVLDKNWCYIDFDKYHNFNLDQFKIPPKYDISESQPKNILKIVKDTVWSVIEKVL